MEPHVEIRDIPEQHVLGIRWRTDIACLGSEIGATYHELFSYLGSKGIQPLGMPYTEYFEVSGMAVDLECGVPVAPGAEGEGRIVARVIPATKALFVIHVGPYETMVDTYAQIDDWIKVNGYAYAGNVREIYKSDPQQEKDSSKWVTEIIRPVRKI
jgi:AraC family transcriptional regulator